MRVNDDNSFGAGHNIGGSMTAIGIGVSPVFNITPVARYESTLVNVYGADEVWPLVNITSGTTILATVDTARNGVLTGWDLQNTPGPVAGTLAPLSGTGDLGNVLSASHTSIFNGDIGSAILWIKVLDGAVWTDGTVRYAFILSADGNNLIQTYKFAGGARGNVGVGYDRRANSVTKTDSTDTTSTDWLMLGFSWDTSVDEQKNYLNGVLDTTLTGLGAFQGALSTAIIGARTLAGDDAFSGWLAYFAVKYGTAWSAQDMLDMYNAAG